MSRQELGCVCWAEVAIAQRPGCTATLVSKGMQHRKVGTTHVAKHLGYPWVQSMAVPSCDEVKRWKRTFETGAGIKKQVAKVWLISLRPPRRMVKLACK